MELRKPLIGLMTAGALVAPEAMNAQANPMPEANAVAAAGQTYEEQVSEYCHGLAKVGAAVTISTLGRTVRKASFEGEVASAEPDPRVDCSDYPQRESVGLRLVKRSPNGGIVAMTKTVKVESGIHAKSIDATRRIYKCKTDKVGALVQQTVTARDGDEVSKSVTYPSTLTVHC